MHMNIGTLALCSTLHQSAHLKIPQMPLSESEIICRDGKGRGSFQRALHLQYCIVHSQLFRIILTSREQPLRIEREVHSIRLVW